MYLPRFDEAIEIKKSLPGDMIVTGQPRGFKFPVNFFDS